MDSEQRAQQQKDVRRTPEGWKRIASRWRIAWMVALVLPAADVWNKLVGNLIDQEFTE